MRKKKKSQTLTSRTYAISEDCFFLTFQEIPALRLAQVRRLLLDKCWFIVDMVAVEFLRVKLYSYHSKNIDLQLLQLFCFDDDKDF